MEGLTFRSFLIALRKTFRKDRKQYYIFTSGASFALIVLSLALDYFTPFETWFMLLRSLLLIPTALVFFSLAYGIGLQMHFQRIENDPEWRPYRTRFSPRTRLQFSIVMAALIFVIIVSTGKSVGYTFISSVVGALIIAVLAFIRTTSEEQKRAEYGIPDARDFSFDLNKRALEQERELRNKANRSKKNKR